MSNSYFFLFSLLNLNYKFSLSGFLISLVDLLNSGSLGVGVCESVLQSIAGVGITWDSPQVTLSSPTVP